jgi:hypothetical protein
MKNLWLTLMTQANIFNDQLLAEFRQLSYEPATNGPLVPPVQAPVEAFVRPGRRRRTSELPTSAVLTGISTTPPLIHSGWEAEQYVASALQQHGWKCFCFLLANFWAFRTK